MGDAWKGLLDAVETHDDDDICEHLDCLHALKAGIREAFKATLHPRKTLAGGEDARLSLRLIERTLRGQTCSFGGHMFCCRQACILVLNMLKLLPEPSFEDVSLPLVGTAAQLVEHLGRQDFSFLHGFVRDCVRALCSVRERPMRLHVFPRFVQLCKAAIDENTGSTAANTATDGAKPGSVEGLPIDLGSAQRLASFCTRLVVLSSDVVRTLLPFDTFLDAASLTEALSSLAFEAVSWSELNYDVAESVKIVSVCLEGLLEFVQLGRSLQVQAHVLEELPRVARFVLRECDDKVIQKLLELIQYIVQTFDDVIMFPCLGEIIHSVWQHSSIDVCMRVLSVAAARFDAIGIPEKELWDLLLVDDSRLAASLSVETHGRLARILSRLAMHEQVCRHAVDRCKCAWDQSGNGNEIYLRLRLLSLGVRSLPQESKNTPCEVACKDACKHLFEQASRLFQKPIAAEPGIYLTTVHILLDTFVDAPRIACMLEKDAYTLIITLFDSLLRADCKPPSMIWKLFNLGLEAFVVKSSSLLTSKFKIVEDLMAKALKANSLCLQLAVWVALGRALCCHFKQDRLNSPQDASKEHLHRVLLALLDQALSDSKTLHPSILGAIAYLFPLLVTLGYTTPRVSEKGNVSMMPEISGVFARLQRDSLMGLKSPVQLMQNPLTVTPKFKSLSDRAPASPDSEQLEVVAPMQDHLCPTCDVDFLHMDWQIFRLDGYACLPLAWAGFRKHGETCCWLTSTPELLNLLNRLCERLLGDSARSALHLMEPGDTQKEADMVQPSASPDLMWLLSCGFFGVCATASARQLHNHSGLIKNLLARLLADRDENRSWDAKLFVAPGRNLLLALIQSDGLCNLLLPAPSGVVQNSWQIIHQLYSDVLKVDIKQAANEGRLDRLSPMLLRVLLAESPPHFVSSILAVLVSRTLGVVKQGTSQARFDNRCMNACLQVFFTQAMLASRGFEDLFKTLPGHLYLRLFDKYSKRNFRASALCELFLQGPLKQQVRCLLPQILPKMVLSENIQAIGDLCALLEESVQSLFTPQLPFILSAIARQETERVAKAFMFILQHIYLNQMTINEVCDASLGKLLVLILWGSVQSEHERDTDPNWYAAARRLALFAIDNIVSALKVEASDRHDPTSQDNPLKRKAQGCATGVAAMLRASQPTKKRTAAGRNAITVGDNPASEVVQTLEDSFLYVLDILEIVSSGDRLSLKWKEYSDLLRGDFGDSAIDHNRLFVTIALLFDLLKDSLHRFSAKLLEFLQSATLASNYHKGSVRCWQNFVQFVTVPRLHPLISAVTGELLRLAKHLHRKSPEACQQVCKIVAELVDVTCKQNMDLVPSLPVMPTWPELKNARERIEGVIAFTNTSVGQSSSDKTNSFVQKFEKGVAQLESATQHAVRSAALENINDLLRTRRREAPTVSMVSQPHLLSTLSKLVQALLKFLWESSARPTDQLHCGELLGTLGALDPSLFSHCGLVAQQESKTPKDLGNEELLIKRVLCDFLVPNLTSKNSYAFAAQEILKYCRGRNRVDRVMAELELDIRETLRPYLSSSYQVLEQGEMHGDVSTFEGVVAKAVSFVSGDQQKLFEACLPAVYGNHALALFLMHHVLHHLLKNNSGTSLKALSELSQCLASLLDSTKHATVQAVFSLIDDLVHRRDNIVEIVHPGVQARPPDERQKQQQQDRINHVMACIKNRKIVDASRRCGAHARALQFLEEALMEEFQRGGVKSKGNLFVGEKSIGNLFDNPRIDSDEDCFLLQSIYRDLDEPDGVRGALRIGPATVRTRTLQLEQSGRWNDVLGCYENQLASLTTSARNATQSKSQQQELLCSMVQCTENMHRFESSLRLIKGMDDEEGMQARLAPFAVEAAGQLSSWDRLKTALQMPGDAEVVDDFRIKLGQSLLAFHEKDHERLQVVLRETRLAVTKTVASAARESYTRAYPHLLKLHVLSDLEWLHRSRDFNVHGKASLAPGLLTRVASITPTFAAREAVLSPLKVALMDMNLIEDAKHIELAFVSLCRKHDQPIALEHPSVSFNMVSSELLLKAKLEWGKLLYARGSRHDALQHMQKLANEHPKARLLGTRWATEASSELLIPMVAEGEFKAVKEKLPENEAAWFYHASYLDHLLKQQLPRMAKPGGTPTGTQTGTPSRTLGRTPSSSGVCPFDLKNLVKFTFKGYLKALHYGNKRMHFVLSRVLQLAWDCCETDFYKADALKEIEDQAKGIHPWMWYTVLSQLMSRAIYNKDLRQLLFKIIVDILVAYPMQSSWQTVQLLCSIDKSHTRLGNDLVLEATRRAREEHGNQKVHARLAQTKDVCQAMISLAQHAPPDNLQVMKLTGAPQFSQLLRPDLTLLIPIQAQMTAVLPRMKSRNDMKSVNPFKDSKVCVQRCVENVEVLRTKERPKKLTFVGTDGLQYTFLCKCERRGDLRKDSRMMEFGVMVNELLARHPDARRRDIEVRTFNVVIFTESCGLIEWVPNTKGMRPIIDDMWKRFRPGVQQTVRELKDLLEQSPDVYRTFTEHVLPRHPPMLYKWFSFNTDPSGWLSKRLMFSRTQALWCMLGYIVGLGDRHGENILLDTESGRVVHVDFDCLFGKGMELAKPETVPFRLTQNCVAAMGVTGIEGVFRNCCELVMEVLRDRANKQTLMAVLHVFVADPLIEWAGKSRHATDSEQRLQTARDTIADVEKKLCGMLNVGAVVSAQSHQDQESVLSSEERGRGLLGRDRGVGLSVAGQVDELLKAAMCKRNLSAMYAGWQPWV